MMKAKNLMGDLSKKEDKGVEKINSKTNAPWIKLPSGVEVNIHDTEGDIVFISFWDKEYKSEREINISLPITNKKKITRF